jgi:hypothetical protein
MRRWGRFDATAVTRKSLAAAGFFGISAINNNARHRGGIAVRGRDDSLVEALALRAEAIAAGAGAVVLTLDVVARVALRVVVVDVALVRVPWRFSCHAV